MFGLYRYFLRPLLSGALHVASIFSGKIRKGLRGRRELFDSLRAIYADKSPARDTILIHVASFGELEQAKPIVRELRKKYPTAFLHLTFFSPSGYDNAKDRYTEVDCISYSPRDTSHDVRTFLDITKPRLALFARYDVWPHMILELNARSIYSIVFSATLGHRSRRKRGILRKLFRETYGRVDHIAANSNQDRKSFLELGIPENKISVVGDTRFDQVVERSRTLIAESLLPEAVQDSLLGRDHIRLVAGSTWPEDEHVMHRFLSKVLTKEESIVAFIVPHEPVPSHIDRLMSRYAVSSILFSRLDRYDGERVVVIDSIGKLFGIYREAHIAFIGGGFGTGSHNALEAAVWGVPVLVGPKHERSIEIAELIEVGGALEVKDAVDFEQTVRRLIEDVPFRQSIGKRAALFVQERQGAARKVMEHIATILRSDPYTS